MWCNDVHHPYRKNGMIIVLLLDDDNKVNGSFEYAPILLSRGG